MAAGGGADGEIFFYPKRNYLHFFAETAKKCYNYSLSLKFGDGGGRQIAPAELEKRTARRREFFALPDA